ncbi:HlyD family efflux transporter periplasmic adaptor subunit [Halieaceae bacterium IMCC14734]|uniref:HlyD family efflux transporter periplasmic adaptor subunit n=1 Tax=Candidatus Litorirhabdus singularis TaxID=2518993 RepID=A0ABT3TLH6_9GAMM|nr:HlyD family efflux transporter periplasmic adaptor subunit [Candidatus Litorirhabdus singularis]MCX2983184.1 HlyD family efflux transporter periplasmic adaptor subunit [Candidatus Litorirhabdus singularis]
MNGHSNIPAALAESWLGLLCQTMPGIARAAVFPLQSTSREPVASASWPEAGAIDLPMRGVAGKALSRMQPVVSCQDTPGSGQELGMYIACPIVLGGQLLGVIAVETNSADQSQQRTVLQMLNWGSLWLQLILQSEGSGPALSAEYQRVLGVALSAQDLTAACTAAATELAKVLGAERVSIGIRAGVRIRLQSLSDNASFDPRANLVRRIEAAMDECLTSASALIHPRLDTDGDVAEAHSALCRESEAGGCLSLPLADADAAIGVLTVESPAGKTFDESVVERLSQLVTLLTPILGMLQQRERSSLSRLLDRVGRVLGWTGEHGRTRRRIAISCAALIVLVATLLPADYRVASNAVLEGTEQRVVVAPMDGFLESVSARPGDTVTAGQILGTLEDQDLLMEKLRWESERAQLQREHREALADRERAKIGILSARIRQADAQLMLLEQQLKRTEFVAPYAGVIVHGDPSQKLGAPVERGEVLFTVAPLRDYRVVLSVDERDIGAIVTGQSGQLVLAAQPDQVLPLSVTTITPVSKAEAGSNMFRVEAALEAPLEQLRPGLQGVAKVEIGRRSRLWLWTHTFTDWLQLMLWTVLG